MSTLSRIVEEMNEEAVNKLKQGNFQDAVSLLDRALGDLWNSCGESSAPKSACDQSVVTRSTYMGNDDSWSTLDESVSFMDDGPTNFVFGGEDTSRRIQSVPISCSPPLKTQRTLQQITDNIFEFYNNALVVHDCPEGNICAVLYNMGVAYHQEAVSRQQDATVGKNEIDCCYQYALNLYNMAQLHLHHAWSKIADEDTKLLLALALSNNSGHIHAYQLNFPQTRYSLEAVQHFVGSIPENETDQDSLLSSDLYSFFVQTSIIYEDNNLGIAPSA